MWSSDNTSSSKGILNGDLLRQTVAPLILIASTPVTSIVLSRAVTNEDGGFIESVFEIMGEFKSDGVVTVLLKDAFNPYAIKVLAVYMVAQLLLMRFMPGEVYKGPVSPNNNRPIYTDNCFACYVASFVLYGLGVYYELFDGGVAFDLFPQLISSMNVFALVFCGVLYLKGILAPSSTDCGTTGNPVFDYYWGTELYPRIFGWDVKVFTNCRYGMTGWALICTSFAYAQYARSGLCNAISISTALQVIYLAKFHIWERGYMYTIDIMHDRAGYYICWGCLVWVPSFYTIHTAFLVLHPYNFSPPIAALLFVLGLLSIYLNYDVDRQRQQFRRQNGKMKINGKMAEYLVAEYETVDGKTHSSMLLTSGWWGTCRKVNYFFELCAAFLWSITFANPYYLIPYFYFTFLLILLLDRAWRDDARCRAKYGKKWDEYCKLVPYMLIPGVY